MCNKGPNLFIRLSLCYLIEQVPLEPQRIFCLLIADFVKHLLGCAFHVLVQYEELNAQLLVMHQAKNKKQRPLLTGLIFFYFHANIEIIFF